MNRKFIIEVCSDLDFEGMIVDISFCNKRVATINYDKGVNNMEIEFLLREEALGKLIFPLKDLFIALEEAKKIAIKCAEEDELRKKRQKE